MYNYGGSNYGCGCTGGYQPMYAYPCCGYGNNYGSNYAIVLVLFILLVIIIGARWAN